MPASGLTAVLSPKGLTVLKLTGLSIAVPLHEFAQRPACADDAQTFLHVKADDPALGEIYADLISVEPSRRDAFVFTTATDQDIRKAALRWSAGGASGTCECAGFPYEFSVRLPPETARFEFTLETTDKGGKTHRSSPLALRPVTPAGHSPWSQARTR
jgi:hypothetical protein